MATDLLRMSRTIATGAFSACRGRCPPVPPGCSDYLLVMLDEDIRAKCEPIGVRSITSWVHVSCGTGA
jgi:hypothetical protein